MWAGLMFFASLSFAVLSLVGPAPHAPHAPTALHTAQYAAPAVEAPVDDSAPQPFVSLVPPSSSGNVNPKTIPEEDRAPQIGEPLVIIRACQPPRGESHRG